MLPNTVYCAGSTPALAQAARFLREKGAAVTDTPQWDVGHLLLDVPSFRPGSPLAEPGKLDTLLGALPRNITVWGGGLSHPALEDYTVVDLLKDETYLARNAGIPKPRVCVVEVPLLDRIESMLNLADEVLVVDCPLEVRRVRAHGRGMDVADFDRRAALQPSDEYLREHATALLDNSGGPSELAEQVDAWWSAHEAAGWRGACNG